MARNNVKLGQKFLVDDDVVAKIVEQVKLDSSYNLVEIGPGRGAITLPLVELGYQFTAIELDSTLLKSLQSKVLGVDFIHSDAMHVDLKDIYNKQYSKKLFVFGNLPYQIASILMLRMRLYEHITAKMLFMVQKEVADRLTAQPKTAAYGRLTVMVQSWCKVVQLFDVSPDSFNPPPKVNSAVFVAYPESRDSTKNLNWLFFEKIVAKSFCHKRKMLYSTFKSCLAKDEWQNLKLCDSARPSDLSVEDYINLTLYLQKKNENDVLKALKA